jgi:hypothetical protein
VLLLLKEDPKTVIPSCHVISHVAPRALLDEAGTRRSSICRRIQYRRSFPLRCVGLMTTLLPPDTVHGGEFEAGPVR